MIDFLSKLLRRFPQLLRFVAGNKMLILLISKLMINKYGYATKPRPRAFSQAHPYASWDALVDKQYHGRHLPEDTKTAEEREYPSLKDASELWRRKKDQEIPSTDTSLMFSFFAQWFTDSFLRTDLTNRKKNISNHQIDLCSLYGLKKFQTDMLRSREGGKLKFQEIDGEIYPPKMFKSPPLIDDPKTGKRIFNFDDDFTNQDAETERERTLHSQDSMRSIFRDIKSEDRLPEMFATGLENGSSSAGHIIMNTIMLREHNRICEELVKHHPNIQWDDERIFQTARNIMIALLLKIVLADYVRHISPLSLPFEAKPGMAEEQKWYRENWISVEFNLLYRWHSMMPDIFSVKGEDYDQQDYRHNTKIITEYGLETLINEASSQKAGKMGLGNTHKFFLDSMPIDGDNMSIQQRTLKMARDAKLQPYNAYRKAFELHEMTSFAELTKDPELRSKLEDMYGNIDNLEWYVGLFAEQHEEHYMMGRLMMTMVAYDAFTHALTNPLLSKNVFNEQTFTAYGLKLIGETTTLDQIVQRVAKKKPVRSSFNVNLSRSDGNA